MSIASAMTRFDAHDLLPLILPIYESHFLQLTTLVDTMTTLVDTITPYSIIFFVFIIWMLIELVFYMYISFIVSPSLDSQSGDSTPLFKHPKDIMKVVYRYYKILGDTYPFQEFISKFCLLANYNEIYSQNYDSLLAFSLFMKPLNALTSEEYDTIDKLRDMASETFNIKWKNGHNSQVEHIKFNLEPVSYIHRPLALYGLLKFSEFCTNSKNLRLNGFTFHKLSKGTSYWIRENKDSKKVPLIFFHGIRIFNGWHYYRQLINELAAERTIILYTCHGIKMHSLVFELPTANDVSSHIREILHTYSIKKVVLLGHSWGTIFCNWVMRLNPEIVHQMVLVDPVSLAAVFPDTIYGLLYRPPTTMLHHIFSYLVRYDLTISNSLHRHLYWYNAFLDYEDIPSNIAVTIAIAAQDLLINGKALIALTEHYVRERKKRKNNAPIKQIVWDLGHGDAFLYRNNVKDIVDAINEIETKK